MDAILGTSYKTRMAYTDSNGMAITGAAADLVCKAWDPVAASWSEITVSEVDATEAPGLYEATQALDELGFWVFHWKSISTDATISMEVVQCVRTSLLRSDIKSEYTDAGGIAVRTGALYWAILFDQVDAETLEIYRYNIAGSVAPSEIQGRASVATVKTIKGSRIKEATMNILNIFSGLTNGKKLITMSKRYTAEKGGWGIVSPITEYIKGTTIIESFPLPLPDDVGPMTGINNVSLSGGDRLMLGFYIDENMATDKDVELTLDIEGV